MSDSQQPHPRDDLVPLEPIPEDNSRLLAHAREILDRHGFQVQRVAAVYEASHPASVSGMDTVLYVSKTGDLRYAILWREGKDNSRRKAKTYPGWPVEDKS